MNDTNVVIESQPRARNLEYFGQQVEQFLVNDGYLILLFVAVPPSHPCPQTHLPIYFRLTCEYLASAVHTFLDVDPQLLKSLVNRLCVLTNDW